MEPSRFLPVVLAGLILSWTGSASTYKPDVLRELADAIETAVPVSVPVAGSIRVGLSPKGGAEVLVLHVIDFAKTDIRALSCSFTSPHVAAAPLHAVKREVIVSLVVNYKNSVTDDRGGKDRVTLSALAKAGCDVRVTFAYLIHHDKVLIADHQIVELESSNYSDAAAHVNSKNVLMNWNSSALAEAYPAHSDRNRRQPESFRARYQ